MRFFLKFVTSHHFRQLPFVAVHSVSVVYYDEVDDVMLMLSVSFSKSLSDCSLPSASINGHLSTMWLIVCCCLLLQAADLARLNLCSIARYSAIITCSHLHIAIAMVCV